jgi:hypothetical protein
MNKSPANDDGLNRRARTLQALCARRAAMDAQIALDEARNPHAAVKLKPWFVYTDRGMRHFVFPALPDALDDKSKSAVCRQWVEQELVSRGMVCDCTLYDTGPIFSCSTREIKHDGFGKIVEEWGTLEFFAKAKASFRDAVNDALEHQGLPRSFQF